MGYDFPTLRGSGGPVKAPTRALRKNMGTISLAPGHDLARPMVYEIPNPRIEIEVLYPALIGLRAHHHQQDESFLLRLAMPSFVRQTLAALRLTLPADVKIELVGHLRLDEKWRGGGVVVGRGEMSAFYPAEYMPAEPVTPRILINVSDAKAQKTRSTFQFMADIAYYSAKASIMSDPSYREQSDLVELLAKLFALSIQHQFSIEFVNQRMVAHDETGALPGYEVTHQQTQLFAGILTGFESVFRIMGQRDDIRAAIVGAFNIGGRLEDMSMSKPIFVFPRT